MRILLPPSEAKHPGGRGRPIDRRPADPLLGAARAEVHGALEALIADDPAAAAQALLLPASVRDVALDANAHARSTPTRPALQRYAGVVYAGLDVAALPPDAQRLAARTVLIFSGLFGVVRGDEAVPDYRVPAKSVLPGLGTLSTFWRPVLRDVVPALCGRNLVIDLRSTDYRAMWRADPAAVAVRVLTPLPSGRLAVVSYASKLAKGQLAAALLLRETAGDRICGADDVAATWTSATGGLATVMDAAGGGGRSVEIHTGASA